MVEGGKDGQMSRQMGVGMCLGSGKTGCKDVQGQHARVRRLQGAVDSMN